MRFINRSWYGNNMKICKRKFFNLFGKQNICCLKICSGHFTGAVITCPQLLDPLRVYVKADGPAHFAESNGNRQTDITEPNN